ncbi:MAG: type II CRISPR-associated endonuclease Cas1 [Oscillospiraceae bacterium]|jgi:CRISPR-associated endonuclease Cas1 subtype II|nr:type II CRISPR-associated endonuclease Cas1 [Oscillospiraceae bacterium]
MSWRTVVISNRCKLDYKLGYMVLRGMDEKQLFLDEVAVIIIESTAVSLTSYLLKELVERKIKVVFCDELHNPVSELMPLYGCHDSSAKIPMQIDWGQPAKTAVWTEIVKEKIKNQACLLNHLHHYDAFELLTDYANDVQLGDITNREGHAAKVYFNALFGQEFSRGQDCNINAALNYGYALLLSAFNREIAANGFLTQLGLNHKNPFNKFNLSCDLMEPFRPLIDSIVIKMMPFSFSADEKHHLLSLFSKKLVIENKEQYFLNAISIYCRSVFASLENNNAELLSFFDGKAICDAE